MLLHFLNIAFFTSWKFFSALHQVSLVCVCPRTCVCTDIVAHQAPLCMGFSRQEYWKGLPRSPPGDLLTQGSNPGWLHCSQILYRLSHQGSFPLQIEGLCQPCIKQVPWCHFSKIIGSLPVSMSYFGDSSNTSTFLMIIKFVMVTCDQRYLMLLF